MAKLPNLKASPAESIFFPHFHFHHPTKPRVLAAHESRPARSKPGRTQQYALGTRNPSEFTGVENNFAPAAYSPPRRKHRPGSMCCEYGKRHSPNIENDATEEVPATHLHNTEASFSHRHFVCKQRPRETKRRFFTRRTIINECKAARVETWAPLKWSGCVDRWHVDEELRDTDRLVAKVIRGTLDKRTSVPNAFFSKTLPTHQPPESAAILPPSCPGG